MNWVAILWSVLGSAVVTLFHGRIQHLAARLQTLQADLQVLQATCATTQTPDPQTDTSSRRKKASNRALLYEGQGGTMVRVNVKAKEHWMWGASVLDLELQPANWTTHLRKELYRVWDYWAVLAYPDNLSSWPSAVPLLSPQQLRVPFGAAADGGGGGGGGSRASPWADMERFLASLVQSENETLATLGYRWERGDSIYQSSLKTYNKAFDSVFFFQSERMHLEMRRHLARAAAFIVAELLRSPSPPAYGYAYGYARAETGAAAQVSPGLSAIYDFARAIERPQANRLQLATGFRYLIAKEFSFVLPTATLIGWLCDTYTGYKRVVSVGAGSCFIETAMHLEFLARGLGVQVICVDNHVEKLG